MQFGQNKKNEKLGEELGFVLAFALFTTILFSILYLTQNLPESWNYLHVIGISLAITAAGKGVRWLLK